MPFTPGHRAAALAKRQAEGFLERQARALFGVGPQTRAILRSLEANQRRLPALERELEAATRAADAALGSDPIVQRTASLLNRYDAGKLALSPEQVQALEARLQNRVERLRNLAASDPAQLPLRFRRLLQRNPELAARIAALRNQQAAQAAYNDVRSRIRWAYPNAAWSYLFEGSPLQIAGRLGIGAFALGALNRWRTGTGTPFTNVYGQTDIAGIPFV